MSEPISHEPLPMPETGTLSPGQIIRQARESMGLHIVALAAALKVPVRKLEALEANRWEELTDITFTRALASSVARHLKIDAAPVLSGLPSAAIAPLNAPGGLGRVESGTSPVLVVAPGWAMARRGWVVGALLVGAGALYFSPQLKMLWPTAEDPAADTAWVSPAVAPTQVVADVPAPSGSAVLAPKFDAVVVSPPSVAPVGAERTASSGSASPAAVAPMPSAEERLLVLSASVDTWVEVTDISKRVRIQRVLKQGEETVFAEGAPFAVVVGNAAGARVTVRGQLLDLAAITKNNVARFEVK